MQKCVQKYIDEVNKAYSEKHQYPIELLLAKPLTEGMDQPQVLRLHKQLVRPENQSIFDLLGDDIPPRMLRLLNDEDLVKLARTSPEFYKLSNDIIDERKSIKLFDLKDLKTLSPEEERYFAKYRHDMLLINAAYHKLKLDHLAYALFEILENHMVQTNALEIIKYDIIQEYSSKRNSGIPSFEEVTKKVLAAVTKNEEFQKASTLIKKIKDAPEADPELNTKYVKQRFLWQVEIAKEILEAIKRGEKPANIRSTSAATDLIYQLTPAFLKKDKYTLTQEIVNETFEDAKVKLGDHDITSKGWQVSNLLHTLKDMKFPDHSKVTIRDFIEIHKYIMKFKMLEANEFDKKYIEKYGEAIYPYKLKSPLFRNKLFYGIDEVIHMIRTHNREFLKVLFSMKEEE